MTDAKEHKADDKDETTPQNPPAAAAAEEEKKEDKEPEKKAPTAAPKEQKGKAVRWKLTAEEQRKVSHPTRVYMGKAVWYRELGIPVVILLIGIWITWSASGWGKKPPTEKADALQAMHDYLEYKIENDYKKRGKRAPNCDMFMASSTIPGVGHSLFAGKDIEEGEIVLPAGEFLPVALSDGTELLIQQYAFHLKHHHVNANVDGLTFWNGQGNSNEKGFDLRATKPIPAGSELFLPFASHPKSQLGPASSLFEDIPTEEDYNLAEEIIHDTIFSFPKRRGKIILNRSEIDNRMLLVNKVTQKLYPKIRYLLPTEKKGLLGWMEAFRRKDVFATAVLKQKTRNALEMSAQCVSYAKLDTDSGVAVATQQFAKGTTIIPSRLLLVSSSGSFTSTRICDSDASNNNDQGECVLSDSPEASDISSMDTVFGSVAKSSCWLENGLPFLLCPLSVASKIEFVDTSEENARKPNVEFKWSPWNPWNKESHSLPVDEVLNDFESKLALDVVALSDIQEGEQLVADSGAIAAILPEQWKASIE